MKESYGKGLATHTVPKSCGVARKGDGEPSTGERAGRVYSRENLNLRGADAVRRSGRPRRARRQREMRPDPARSETPSTSGYTRHGNREIPESPAADGAAGRIGKPTGDRR